MLKMKFSMINMFQMLWSIGGIILLISVSSILSQPYLQSNVLLTMTQLDRIAVKIETKLSDLHNQYTYMDLLPESDGRVLVEDVNSETLMESMAFRISTLFKDKQKALKKIAKTLEEASRDYNWYDYLRNNFTNVVFMNTTTEREFEDKPGTMDELFGVRVNKSMIGIHVPLEVYEGWLWSTIKNSKHDDPEIVNGLNWSSAVDETFKKNAQSDPTLGWQYFASESGFMRLYPSVAKWYIPPPYDPVDLFDARRRSWYIQGSVSPKDVIILMDRSGSVHGQTFTIMKFAVETLIDTLGENDFVNIGAFNETTSWISDIVYNMNEERDSQKCCQNYNESLLQATNLNKKALVDDMKHLSVKGMANYSAALEFAYQTFKRRSHNGENSADCHKLIMLFSDGGTDWPQEVVDKYTNDSDTMDVRIFTYAVGPHPIPTAVLKQMACETGGQYTVITTSSGVRTKIQESYLDIISEALAESDKHSYSFSSPYTSAVTENLTISITLPVFNMSYNSTETGQKSLSGVAGVDIPVQHLENFSPRESLGPLGYTFLINQNGFLIMHPDLISQNSYLQDPLHLDFLDMELNAHKLVDTRRQMIHGDRGGIAFTGKLKLDKNYILEKGRIKYTFMPIHDSPYSLGMVTLPSAKHLHVSSNIPITTIDPRTSILAPWDFCGFHPALPESDLTNKRIIEDIGRCNQLLINNVMWAQEWTNTLVEEWEKNADKLFNITSRAIYTRFGLTRVVVGRFEVNGTIVFPPTSMGVEWRDPSKNPALKRGLIGEGLSIFPNHQGAFMARPTSLNSVVAAVVGLNVTSDLLDYELSEIVSSVATSNSSFIMMIDEAAYIISSTQLQNSSGEFLGERWPLLLEKLIEAGIYGKENITDYQATCDDAMDNRGEFSSGSKIDIFFQPLRFLASTIIQLVSFAEYLQYILLHGFIALSTTPGTDAIYKAGVNEACILQHSVYYLTDMGEFSGNISCMGDSAQVLVRRINSMNAIVVAVEQSLVNLNCDGWREKRDPVPGQLKVSLERKRRINPKEIACRVTRDRRKPDECETALPTKCNGSSRFSTSSLLLFLLLCVHL